MSYFADYNGAYFAPYFGEVAPSVDLSETIVVAETIVVRKSTEVEILDVWEFGFGQGGPPPSYDPATISTLYGVTIDPLTETITLGEAVAAFLGSVVTETEAVSVAEALATLVSYFVSPIEQVAVAESVSAVLQLVVAEAETLAVTEAVASRYDAVVAQGEAVATTEALSALTSTSIALADHVDLAELIAASKAVAVSLTDAAIDTDEAILVMVACAQQLLEDLSLDEQIDIVAHTTAVVIWIVATIAETLYAADVAPDETLATIAEFPALKVDVTSSSQKRVPILSASAQAAPEVVSYTRIDEINPTTWVEEIDREQPTIHPQMEFGDPQTTVSLPLEGKE